MYIFIVNPVAGKGRAEKIHARVMQDTRYKQLHTETYVTSYHGHAKEITEQIIKTYDLQKIEAFIVIGGDGTFHEVVNGLGQKQVPISFIPGGSGNDFARGCAIPKKPQNALHQVFSNQQTVPYWLGTYVQDQNEKQMFVNCVGFGFDAVVTKAANRSRFKSLFNMLKLGNLVYLLALIRSLATYKPFAVTVDMDGMEKEFTNCFLMTVNNQPYFGGGMKINPKAINNGEHFSILVIDSISRLKIFALFSTVFTGSHLRFKEVQTFEAKQIKIKAPASIPFQVDGETGDLRHCFIQKKPVPLAVKGSVTKRNGQLEKQVF